MKAQGIYSVYLHHEILRVVPTYVGLGCVVLLLAVLISRAEFPASLDTTAEEAAEEGSRTGAYRRLLGNPQLMFAVVAQFFYVGAQVSTWSTLIPYLRAYTKVSEREAGYFLTATLVAFALGRIVSTPLMRYINPARMTGCYAVISLALIVVGMLRPGMVGAGAILATSLFMSVMYPTIFALGVKGLGRDTKLGGSLLVIAILGGALFPPLMGFLSRLTNSLALGYSLPALSFIVIATYAFAMPRLSNLLVSRHSVEVAPHPL